VVGALLADRAEQQTGETTITARADDKQFGVLRGFVEGASGCALDDAPSYLEPLEARRHRGAGLFEPLLGQLAEILDQLAVDNPTAAQTSTLARRVARELKAAGWQLERVLADNGNEYRGQRFHQTIERLGARITHIHAGRPQTNGHVEALHKTILDECWRPAFARHLYPRYSALGRELDRYLSYYNTDRVHHGRLTNGRIPADIVYAANKMKVTR
jgi:Integrase core domain